MFSKTVLRQWLLTGNEIFEISLVVQILDHDETNIGSKSLCEVGVNLNWMNSQ